MATKSVITKIRRKKMAEASHTTGTVAKITHIALGSGGVNGDGTVIVPLAENVALKKEVVRKPYTSSTKTFFKFLLLHPAPPSFLHSSIS